MAHEIPTWFADAVTEGMQMLVTLSLPGTPPAETIGLAADVWHHALWRAGEWRPDDARRLQAAFWIVARRVERWPAPKHVLDALPPLASATALPPPALTPEQIKKNRAFLRRLLEQLNMPKAQK